MKYEIEKWFRFINWKPTHEELQSALFFFSDEREAVRAQFEKLSCYATKEEQLHAVNYLVEGLLPEEYIFLLWQIHFLFHSTMLNVNIIVAREGKRNGRTPLKL